MRYYELKEIRKNPEKNPKMGIIDTLEKYSKDPNIFISFVNVQKIGINPSSTFGTPNGIYTYPLKTSFANLVNYKTNTIDVPYQSKAPGVYILRVKDPSSILDLGTYTEEDLAQDEKKLAQIIIDKFVTVNQMSPAVGYEYAKGLLYTAKNNATYKEIPGGVLWNMTRHVFMFLKGQIGFSILDGNDDFITNLITGDKNKQADFNDKLVRTRGIVSNLEKKPTTLWNSIFRKLGYMGVYDSKGVGIIHKSEKTQAVFFTTQAFDVLEYVLNKPYRPQKTINKKHWLWPTDKKFIRNILDFYMGHIGIEGFVSSKSSTASGSTIMYALNKYTENVLDIDTGQYLQLQNTPVIGKMASSYQIHRKDFKYENMPAELFFAINDNSKAGIKIDENNLTIILPNDKMFSASLYSPKVQKYPLRGLFMSDTRTSLDIAFDNVIDKD